MSKTRFIEYRDRGFWAYDVVLSIFLKHLIDVAQVQTTEANGAWLAPAIHEWRIIAVVGDYGFTVDESWSVSQCSDFLSLAEQACALLSQHDKINAEEIAAWPILDDLHIFARGETEIPTRPIMALGKAIISLVDGTLPVSPAGTVWLYGLEGRTTMPVRIR